MLRNTPTVPHLNENPGQSLRRFRSSFRTVKTLDVFRPSLLTYILDLSSLQLETELRENNYSGWFF